MSYLLMQVQTFVALRLLTHIQVDRMAERTSSSSEEESGNDSESVSSVSSLAIARALFNVRP